MSEIFSPNVSVLSGCRANNEETTEFDFFLLRFFFLVEKPFSYFLQRKGGGARKITPPFTRSRLRHKRKGKRLPFFTDKTHSFLREADVRVHLSFFRKKSVACLPLPLPFPVAPITTSSSSVFPDITKEKSHFLLFLIPTPLENGKSPSLAQSARRKFFLRFNGFSGKRR